MGCYNSGTTLLQSLVSNHPDVSTLPFEGVRLTRELSRPEDYGWTRLWYQCEGKIARPAAVEQDAADRISRDWGAFLDPRASVYLEKSISNLPRLAWLDLNFQPARFVGIVRDPYAVAEGIRRKAVPRPPVLEQVGRQYPLRWTAEQWLRSKRVMEEQASGREFLLVRYEDLVETPVPVLSKVFDFIGLELPEMSFEGGRVTIDGTSTAILSATNEQSMARLSSSDLAEISTVVSADLEELGYRLQGGAR